MIITIIADVFGESNNGTTMTIKRLINGLIERGHTVRLVSCSDVPELESYTLTKRNFYIFNGYLAKNGVELAKPNDKILRQAIQGADLVHIAVPFKTGKHAVKIAKELNVPVTAGFHVQAENVTAHVFLRKSKIANNFIYRYFYRTFFKNVKFVHCPSKMIADILRENHYDMNLRVISNGVAPSFHPIENPVRPETWRNKYLIAFVGRLSKEKCHPILIEAVKLSKYADKIQLVFAGDGPQKARLQKMGNKLPNPLYISFYPNEELVNLLNTVDIYVHPSDAEIEAISCLEALSCGCVPIISDSPVSATNHFALSKKNLFHAGDAQDLANKIDYWIEHYSELQDMKKLYADYAEQYRLDLCLDNMVKMFEEAINEHKN